MRWLNNLLGHRDAITTYRKPTRRPAADRSRTRLKVESLEDRDVPVVGAFSVPDAIVPATNPAFDGVVQVQPPPTVSGPGSGSLLWTGRHILTAAHIVDGLDADSLPDFQNVVVQFDMPSGPVRMTSTAVTVHPSWNNNGVAPQFDFAIIELPSLAPFRADRYSLYRDSNEVGQVFTVVGYGATGTGAGGHDNSFGVKHVGQNRFEAVNNTQLRFDFDDGIAEFGGLIDLDNRLGDSGLGRQEADTAVGDSGGPSFINWQIAAVTSGGTLNAPNTRLFGDVSWSGRVSTVAPWIDGIVNLRDDIVLDMNVQETSAFENAIDVWLGTSDLWLKVNGLETAIPLTQINSLTIRGTAGSETIWIKDGVPDQVFPVVVDAGAGTALDTLIGPTNTWNSWEITGANRGTLDRNLTFRDVENLWGGTSGDGFTIRPSGSLTGEIRGGTGYPDTLNYSQFIGGVRVDLTALTATAVGRVSEIENVRGGHGSDFLIGNGVANMLEGNGGRDTLMGLGGEDWLFGGAEDDYLDGGHDHKADHLFGGTGVDTFVRHYNLVFSQKGGFYFWLMEADETDYNPLEDKLSVLYH